MFHLARHAAAALIEAVLEGFADPLGVQDLIAEDQALEGWQAVGFRDVRLAGRQVVLEGEDVGFSLRLAADRQLGGRVGAVGHAVDERAGQLDVEIAKRYVYYQARDRASYESRKRKAKLRVRDSEEM